MEASMPAKMSFGTDGPEVTRVGLGGEGVLRTFGREEEARSVIQAAIDNGIGYFDTAPAYSGSEGYLGEAWSANPGVRETVFHTSKSAQRTASGALADLDRTLETLGTDYLDLWQIHDVRTMDDVQAIEGQGGALEAFVAARERGTVRHIGVTGHHDPRILTHCITHWPLDSVLLPVNPLEGALGGFLTETMPAALERGMAVIAMKILGGGHYVAPESGLTARSLLAYALSYPVTVAIAGCSTPEEVKTLVTAGAEDAPPMGADERRALEDAFRPHARRLAFYRGVL
ncbi:aldo/keto reductase [Oceanidesulfovibrio marinus]|uniref:Aldo/keto reductase n=2 Tax=Oceanidesulfovibrio marinus TaxID=370038 RepID=A0A6P1ZM77_9BACT|nr:aldo/keto reductase [Oceanidesulfovibrio marinus]